MSDDTKSMKEELGVTPPGEPCELELDLAEELRRSRHRITDYSPSAHKYVKQQRMSLVVKHGRTAVLKQPISSYQLITHRDQFDTKDADGRTLLVDSDETVIIIVARAHEPRNAVGRALRVKGAAPMVTLQQTLNAAMSLGDEGLGDGDHEGDANGCPSVGDPEVPG